LPELQRLQQLQSFGELLDLGLGISAGDLLTQAFDLFRDVDGLEQLIDCLGTHTSIKLIAVLLDSVQVLLVSQQLTTLQRGHARIDHHEGLEVEHPLDVAQGHIHQ